MFAHLIVLLAVAAFAFVGYRSRKTLESKIQTGAVRIELLEDKTRRGISSAVGSTAKRIDTDVLAALHKAEADGKLLVGTVQRYVETGLQKLEADAKAYVEPKPTAVILPAKS